MEYKRFTDKIFLRADRGEELVSAIVSVSEKENVRLASVSGIGAAGLIRAGYFDVAGAIMCANTAAIWKFFRFSAT